MNCKSADIDEVNGTQSKDPYAGSRGVALTGPDSGKYVALHHHPRRKFHAQYGGIVPHCEWAIVPHLESDSVEELQPPWFRGVAQDTDEGPDDWMEHYPLDHRDEESWSEEGDCDE